MPQTPYAFDVSQYTNDGASDSHDLVTADLDGATWLDTAKRPTGAWCIGPDGTPTATENGVKLNDSARTVYDLGATKVVPISNGISTLRIHLRIKVRASADSITYRANIGGQVYDLFTPDTEEEDWFISDPLSFFAIPGSDVDVQLLAAPTGPDFDHVLQAICVLADVNTEAADWPKASPRLVQTDSPDDNHFVKSASDQLEHIAERYPKGLASHSFGQATSSGDGSISSLHRYRVRGGPQPIGIVVWVLASGAEVLDDGDPAGDVGSESNDLTVTLDSDTQTQSLTSLDPTWYRFGSFTLDGEDLHELTVEGLGDEVLAGVFRGVKIHRVCAFEAMRSPEDVLVVDPNSPNERTDPAPQTFLRPDTTRAQQGAIITATGLQAFPLPEPLIDRVTALHNRTFEALHRTQNLVCDHLIDPGDGPPSTTATLSTTPAVLTSWKHRNTRGGVALQVFARLRRVGTARTDSGIAVRVKVGDQAPLGRFFPLVQLATPQWCKLPAVALPDDDSELDCELQAGFVRDQWDNAPTSPESDAVVLDGFCFVEIGNTSGRNYYYRRQTGLGISIAAGHSATWGIGVAAGEAFFVRHVRAYCVITGPGPSSITATLSRQDGTTITLKASGDPLPAGWLSDDEVTDKAAHDPLLTLAGVDATGTWGFHVTNSSGSTIVLDGVGIELR